MAWAVTIRGRDYSGPGTLYYVGIGGSDLAAGTSWATRWATLTKAGNTLVAGDGVLIGAGGYAEALIPTHSGSAGNPIQFVGDPDGEYTGAVGTVCVLASGLTYALLGLAGTSYLAFRHLRTVNASYGITLRGTHCEVTDVEILGATDIGVYSETAAAGTIIRRTAVIGSKYTFILYGGNERVESSFAAASETYEGIYVSNTAGTRDIVNCTLLGNRYGLVQNGAGCFTRLANCIVYGNENGLRNLAGTMSDDYCCVSGNQADRYGTITSTNPVAGPPTWTALTAPWRIAAGSPTIGAGSAVPFGGAVTVPTHDLEGVEFAAPPDPGCYQYTAAAVTRAAGRLDLSALRGGL